MTPRQVVVLPDAPAVAVEAARRLAEIAAGSVAERGRCIIALSGGSTPALFHRTLAASPWRQRIPWAQLHVCWGDERCVPPDHPESNYGAAWRDLLASVPLPAENIHRMAGEGEPEVAARAYEAELRRVFCGALDRVKLRSEASSDAEHAWLDGPFASEDANSAESEQGVALALDCQVQRFDLVVLGLGLDGHVASLFPGAPALDQTERLVVATLSPAGQPRLTLTLPAINAARQVLMLVTGAAKAGIVAAALGTPAGPPLPAQRLAPVDGTLTWLLDRAAAADL